LGISKGRLFISDKENGQEKSEMGAYRLFAQPDTMPTIDGSREFTISYWIIRTWSNTKPVAADSLVFSGIGKISAADASSPRVLLSVSVHLRTNIEKRGFL
jgi:hypothetical protein